MRARILVCRLATSQPRLHANRLRAACLAAALVLCATLPSSAIAREAVTYLLPAAITQPAFAPWIIAKQLGYYADAGYDVTFATARGGEDVARRVAGGTAEIGGALGDTPIIVRGQGVKMKAIAVLDGGALTTLVAGPRRGIHTLGDLRGKRVMVLSFNDTTYHVLLGALAGVGLRKTDLP